MELTNFQGYVSKVAECHRACRLILCPDGIVMAQKSVAVHGFLSTTRVIPAKVPFSLLDSPHDTKFHELTAASHFFAQAVNSSSFCRQSSAAA